MLESKATKERSEKKKKKTTHQDDTHNPHLNNQTSWQTPQKTVITLTPFIVRS